MDRIFLGTTKILVFLMLGVIFRRTKLLGKTEISGLKKIILNIALPSVLLISFSSLDYEWIFLPVIVIIFGINIILHFLAVIIYKATGSTNRLIVLNMSTMNYSLIGIPLYEAFFGIENLHSFTILGVGSIIYIWVFYYPASIRFLHKDIRWTDILLIFLKSPMIWGILFGCFLSIVDVALSESSYLLLKSFGAIISHLSMLATPLILFTVGYDLTLSFDFIKSSIKLTLLKLGLSLSVAYILKFTILDLFMEGSSYFNAAYFLIASLPTVFTAPIVNIKYLKSDESTLFNNTIVFHASISIAMFILYMLILM